MTRAVSDATTMDWRSLAKIPLFATLAEERPRVLWARSLPRRYAARQVLRNAGDPATHLLRFLYGRVAATVTNVGRADRSLRRLCGALRVGQGRRHRRPWSHGNPHSAHACAVRRLLRDLFHALVDNALAARRHVLRILADHARREQARFTATATLPTDARLAAWLLEKVGEASDSRVTLPGSQETLADLLGVTRVTINRALMRLCRDGLISVKLRRVDILAPELLRLRAGG